MSAALPFCSSTGIGSSVPPKEPPSSDVRHLPQSASQLQPKEPDPINYPSAFLSSLASAMVVPSGCLFGFRKLAPLDLCQKSRLAGYLTSETIAIKGIPCKCSVQTAGSPASKPLGEQTANALQNRERLRPDHKLNLIGSIPSHPPPHAGCPRGDPDPLRVL